ncbi:MAG: hypothetical protein H6619_06725 [Deltaproteobacteria bacterium]|nr:hypothetical protein [Deltaproteobacteria bacterium]
MNIDPAQQRVSPLEELYQRIVVNDELNNGRTKKVNTPDQQEVIQNFEDEPDFMDKLAAGVRTTRQAIADSALGFGHFVSKVGESTLLQKVAPKLSLINKGLGRVAGGAITVGTTGYRLYKTARNDLSNNDYSLPETRKELTLSLGSIGAAGAVGEAGYLITAAALGLGAPSIIITGLAGATLLGSAYAAYKARAALSSYYDQIVR